jgi:peptidyl-prolyl cis-trans isomerase D
MLNVMRDNLKHLKWVLWLVAISMVAYLGAFFSCDDLSGGAGPSSWAASVNGSKISADRFRATARNLDSYYRQLFDTNYEQLKPQLQIGTQAVQSLIEQEVILQDGRRLGLKATAEEVAENIRNDPNFQDPTGQFIGKERYVQLVRRAFGGPDVYERMVSEQIVVDKWTNLIDQSATVADAELEELHRQRTEKTAIDYVVVRSADQQIDTEFSDAELRAWYDAHPDSFMRAEGRQIRFVVVEREAQSQQVEITDADVQAAYESNQANYSHPEQRRASHVLLRVEPDATEEDKQRLRQTAEQLRQRLESGEDFASLAQAMSQDPGSAANGGDLGFFGRGQMVPAFESAAFDTPVGELAPVTESEFGFHVIQVTDERAAGVVPLEEVEESIRRTLRLRKAQERVTSEAQRLQEALRVSDIGSVAQLEGLGVEERFVSAGERLAEIGAAPDFVDNVLTLETGEVSSPLRVASGMALVVADELVPASVMSFEEANEAVRTELLDERLLAASRSRAREALESGGTFSAAVEALGLEAEDSGDLGPGQPVPGTGGSASELDAHLFGPDVEVDRTDVVEVPTGALLYRVSRRESFDPESFLVAKPALRQELLQERQSPWRQTDVQRLREGQPRRVWR